MKREKGIRNDWASFEGIKNAIPKKKLVKRSHIEKHTAESELQEYAEKLAEEHCIPFFRIPNAVLEWIYCNPNTPENVIESANEYIKGLPDITLLKPIDGSRYCMALIAEIKTASRFSKLRASQKEKLRGLNFVIPRTKEQIKQEIEDFGIY